MKFFQRLGRFCGTLLVAAVFGLCGAQQVWAEDGSVELPDYRLQLSPARQDIGELKPGSTYKGTIKVQNTGKNSFKYRMSVTPYNVIDEKYTQDFENASKYNDITNWVTFSRTTGELEPGTEDEVGFTVKVPTDVPAGGQYAILMAELVNDGNSSQTSGISTIQRVGTVLYSNVEGETRRTGGVSENKVPSILFNPPITATSIVENTGNIHASATYVLQVYPLFGDEEVYTNEEKPVTLTILPETRRFNTMVWEGAPHLGIFRVKQTVTIFDETSITEKVVFLCPIWFLLIVLVIIFCVIFWIISQIRTRKQS